MRKILILVCFGVVFVGGCTREWIGPKVEPLKAGDGVVESGLYQGVPFVMASINGSEPMKFLFDTGAAMDMLTPEAAKALGIHATGNAKINGSSGLNKKIPIAFLDRVEFGPIAMSDMLCIIAEFPSAILSDPTHGIAGIIGIRGLEAFTMDIDYPNRRVSITQDRLDFTDPDTTVLYTPPSSMLWVPMRVPDPEDPAHTLSVWSQLDTGSRGILGLDEDAQTLVWLDDATDGVHSMGIHGIDRIGRVAPLKTVVRLGETDLEGAYASIDSAGNRLGSDLLQNFRVRIDGRSGLVSFTRSDHAKRLVSIQRMGITNLWQMNGFRIDQVIEGSAADLLGLSTFDQVVAIDGVAPNELHLKTSYWAVGDDATTMTIRIVREGDDTEVEVVLPIDGEIDGIAQREKINLTHKGVKVQIKLNNGETREQEIHLGSAN